MYSGLYSNVKGQEYKNWLCTCHGLYAAPGESW